MPTPQGSCSLVPCVCCQLHRGCCSACCDYVLSHIHRSIIPTSPSIYGCVHHLPCSASLPHPLPTHASLHCRPARVLCYSYTASSIARTALCTSHHMHVCTPHARLHLSHSSMSAAPCASSDPCTTLHLALHTAAELPAATLQPHATCPGCYAAQLQSSMGSSTRLSSSSKSSASSSLPVLARGSGLVSVGGR